MARRKRVPTEPDATGMVPYVFPWTRSPAKPSQLSRLELEGATIILRQEEGPDCLFDPTKDIYNPSQPYPYTDDRNPAILPRPASAPDPYTDIPTLPEAS